MFKMVFLFYLALQWFITVAEHYSLFFIIFHFLVDEQVIIFTFFQLIPTNSPMVLVVATNMSTWELSLEMLPFSPMTLEPLLFFSLINFPFFFYHISFLLSHASIMQFPQQTWFFSLVSGIPFPTPSRLLRLFPPNFFFA
jgi:hypothetical protein